jgi:hypothetical protein
MNGERPDKAATAIAEVAIAGAAAASNRKPATRSAVSGSEKFLEELDSPRSGLSKGPRLMVDTAKMPRIVGS